MGVSKEAFLIDAIPHFENFRSKILSYQMQEQVQDRWLEERFRTVLPALMKRTKIDCWVVACREYNEDPVVLTLLPANSKSARRTTILVFKLEGKEVKRISIARPGFQSGSFYEGVWKNQMMEHEKLPSRAKKKGEKPETQMACLTRVLEKLNPKKIGLNVSKDFAYADGLSKSLYDDMMAHFPASLQKKVVSAENLALGWLETRTPTELQAYTGIVQMAHGMIAEAFSSRVVHPGVTTNEDVKYWMLQSCVDLGLPPWFDYEVNIQRAKVGDVPGVDVIQPGDILHCDVGFKYLGLCTDTQEDAYVCKLGEVDAPKYLKKAMAQVNRFQDIVVSCFKEGRTGNEILKMAREKAIKEHLKPSLYTHPLGYHGHAAGPTIGLWDHQGGVPGWGEYPLYENTCYALELNCAVDIKEWGCTIPFCMETDISYSEGKVHYLAGRQEQFHLIK